MEKKCNQCKLQKDSANFYKHKKTKDRLHPSCKTCHNIKYKTNRSSEENLKILKAYRNRPENKIKVLARATVQRALKKGILHRKSCYECGESKTEAHHHNYILPLEVLWLCRKHHLETHSRLTIASN